MPFQPATDCVEVVLRFDIAGKEAINRINCWSPGGYSQGNLDSLATIVDAQVGEFWTPLMNAQTNYAGTDIRGLSVATDLFAHADAEAATGSASGAALPANVSYVVTLGTGFTGRSARGRLYWMPPAATGMASSSTVTTTYSDGAVDKTADLLDLILSSTGFIPVILSRVQDGVPLDDAFPYVITDIIARNLLTDSQRGRLPEDH